MLAATQLFRFWTLKPGMIMNGSRQSEIGFRNEMLGARKTSRSAQSVARF